MAEKCNDFHCPVHGSLHFRGRSFTGTVLSTKMQKTAIVQWESRGLLPKFERYEKRKSKVKAHNPACLGVKKGDIVEIKECRPLSKTKHFIIIKKIGEDILFEEKQELLEAGKTRSKKKESKEEVAKEESEENESD
ncbi:30S ribosomal protein S17 [Candidatus Woesearchaeota archaeon]|nr:30S ribosomal protein S17 [Candidatus Woesearchaeota archaeon]